jgi:hypothetical protein
MWPRQRRPLKPLWLQPPVLMRLRLLRPLVPPVPQQVRVRTQH